LKPKDLNESILCLNFRYKSFVFEILKKCLNQRWVILRHILSKDSLEGCHFDLLLEDGDFCRTWHLKNMPRVNGPSVEVTLIAPHKLHWLDREECEVSGGRGWAKRVEKGYFDGSLPRNEDDLVSIEINSSRLSGRLEIGRKLCKLISSSKFHVN
tara:strand:- start:1006 stop:1470 length:465 start_codon:yes stop_codon:yes gene_type:complete